MNWFENVVERDVVLAGGVSAAGAFGVDAMTDAHGLVADPREIPLRER